MRHANITLRHPGSRAALSTACVFAVAIAIAVAASEAAPPPWWGNSNALDGSAPTTDENYRAANLGQAKWMATLAHAAMEVTLPGGAGFPLTDLFPEPPANPGPGYLADQYRLLNLGQLKFMAKPFYDRLEALGYDNRAAIESEVTSYLPGWSHPYPWEPDTPVAENFQPANIGQLKMVFSFDIDAAPGANTPPGAFTAVVWRDLVGSKASYPANAGSTLEKTDTTTGWDSDAVSLGILPADGTLRFKVGDPGGGATKSLLIGLSQTNPDSAASVGYGFELTTGGQIQIIGNAGSFGTFTFADQFELTRQGTTLNYGRNGAVFHATTLANSAPLIVDCSLHDAGVALHDCESTGFYAAAADSDNDGLPDWWEVANGLDPDSHSVRSTDTDQDGFTDYEEFLAGTDPGDGASDPAIIPSALVIHRP